MKKFLPLTKLEREKFSKIGFPAEGSPLFQFLQPFRQDGVRQLYRTGSQQQMERRVVRLDRLNQQARSQVRVAGLCVSWVVSCSFRRFPAVSA